MSNVLATWLLCVFFLLVGLVALVWPERIRGWTLSFYVGARGLTKWNPLLGWMRTSSYIMSLRIIGTLSLAAGFLVLLVVARGGG